VNRPGPAGFAVLLAFAVVAVIELRTLLGMVGLDVPVRIYLPAAGLALAVAFGTLWLSGSETGGNANRARR